MANSVISTTVEVNSKGAEQAVGSIKARLREARTELTNAIENFGEFSQEAVTAAKKVEGLKGTIDDASRLVNAFDGDRKFQAFGQSIGAVASGFTAAQGAIGLFGTESAEVEQALLKVNSAMALSQGINGVLEGTKSFKDLGNQIKGTTAFQKAQATATTLATKAQKLFTGSVDTTSKGFKGLKGAIIATGIGALVVLLGLVIENFDSIKKVIEKLLGPLKGITDFVGKLVTGFTDFIGITSEAERETERLKKATEKNNTALENQIEIMQAQGATSKEIRAIKNKMYEDELANLRLVLAANGKLSEEEAARFRELQQQQKVLQAEGIKEDKDAEKEAADKKAEAAKKAATDAIAEGKRQNEKAKANRDAAIQKEIDDLKNKNQTALELAKINGEDVVKLRDQQIDAEIALLKKKGPKFAEAVAALEKEKLIAAATAIADGQRAEIDAQKLRNQQIIELAKIAGQDTVGLRAKQIDEEIALLKSKKGNFVEEIAALEREKVVAGAQAQADATAKAEEKKKVREQLAKELQKVNLENDLINLKAEFDSKFLLLEGDLEAQKLLREKYEKDVFDTKKNYTDKELELEERKRNARNTALRETAAAFGTLSNIIGKQTVAGKALAIAEATINAYVAGSNALKAIKTAKTPIDAIAGIATMAAVIASGLKTVREIVKVKVPGFGGGAAPGGLSAPTFAAPVLPQAESTRLDPTQVNQIGNAASRAYVVESDITGNQDKIKRLNRQARIN